MVSSGIRHVAVRSAVSSNAQMPEELLAYQLEGNSPNPFVRLEPINSIRRIAEDRVNLFTGSGESS